MRLKDESSGEQHFRDIRFDPHFSNNHLNWLAQAHLQLGEFEQAAKLLRQRIVRKPDADISGVLLAAV